MSRRTELLGAWTKIGTDVLGRMSEVPTAPKQIMDWVRAPTRAMMEMHAAWLETVGGVPAAKYQKVLEENLELRRRLERVERAPPSPVATEAAAEAIDDAFQQIRTAQEQWLSMWMPGGGAPERDE